MRRKGKASPERETPSHEYVFSVPDTGKTGSLTLADGNAVTNLLELSMCLKQMSMKDFRRMVSQDRNEICEWLLRHVKDKDLADKVGRLVMKDKIELAILRGLIGRSREIVA